MLPTAGSVSRAALARLHVGGRGEVVHVQRVAAADQHGALDPLPELTHVARPRLRLQPAPRRRRQREPIAAIDVAERLQEARGENRNVGRTLAQRRQVDGDQVDAIEQILAKFAARHHVRQRAVGRRDDAHVHLAPRARPEHFVGAILQHAQHLHLRGGVEVADLVEEDRPAVRELEAALAIVPRVREGAAHVAEHLAFEERRRDAAEIHFDERPRLTPAVAMDRFRHELLAGAALAGDQHRRIGRGDAPHQLQDAQQPRVFAHQVAEVVFTVQLLARRHALVALRARRARPSAVCTVWRIC